MTTPNRILVDLLAGQATPDALAERIRIPMLAIKSMCLIHERDGLLEHTDLAESLFLFRLTAEGREVASALNLQPV